jgi:hypothetical protein
MAFPTISGPYGLKPVNLIGGQVFAGSTRNYPVQYGYATNIFYGDIVSITRGFVTRLAVTTGGSASTGAAGEGFVGIFLGCSYTNPLTKQKAFSQYWPASTLAGDAVAIVTDDPDTVFKAAVVTTQGGIVIGSASRSMIGLNMAVSNLAGNVNTGNSSNGILASSAATTAALPVKIIDVVQETAIPLGTATWSSGTTTLTLSATNNTLQPLPVGADVGFLASNGQFVGTANYVSTAVTTAGATSVVVNAQYGVVNAGGVAATATVIPTAATMVFTQYQEVLCKINFATHSYYTALGTQTA